MKYSIIIFVLLLSVSSCKKETPEIKYVNHDKEIFIGEDTLIYGRWEYLYTSYDNIGGGHSNRVDNHHNMNITRFDNYEMTFGNNILTTGKIDTLGHLWNSAEVVLYPDGKINETLYPQLLGIYHADTLVNCLFIAFDAGVYDYYKRIK
jgi:hypothetical protein